MGAESKRCKMIIMHQNKYVCVKHVLAEVTTMKCWHVFCCIHVIHMLVTCMQWWHMMMMINDAWDCGHVKDCCCLSAVTRAPTLTSWEYCRLLTTNHRLRVSFTYSCSWSLTCVEIYCILCSSITMKLLPDYPFMWQISSWLMKKSLVISFWNIYSKYSVKSEHFNNSRFKPDFSVATTSILQNILHNNDN